MQASNINSRPMLLLGTTSVASPAQSAPKDDETRFYCSEQAALAQGMIVATAQGELEAQWDTLLPLLHDIWSHMSQRGDHYIKAQTKGEGTGPQTSWNKWSDNFCALTGLHRKTLQRRVMAYRNCLLGSQPQNTVTPKLATKSEIAVASHGVSAPTTNYERRPSPGAADALRNDDVDDEDHSDWHSVPEEDRDPSQLKPGDRSGLATHVVSRCAKAFSAVLAGLSPRAKLDILDYVFRHILQCYFAPGHGDGEVALTLTYIPPKPPQLRKEWHC